MPRKEADFMEAGVTSKGTLITGVIGDDVHNMGIGILEYALRKAGFTVVSLGIHTSQEEFINAALETKAQAILISSLSGHGALMCEGFRDKCLEAGLEDILLYAGGRLVVGAPPWEETEKVFLGMGFTRAYPPAVLPGAVIADLEADLQRIGV
jgi:methylaspartate mutase sigma subunit